MAVGYQDARFCLTCASDVTSTCLPDLTITTDCAGGVAWIDVEGSCLDSTSKQNDRLAELPPNSCALPSDIVNQSEICHNRFQLKCSAFKFGEKETRRVDFHHGCGKDVKSVR